MNYGVLIHNNVKTLKIYVFGNVISYRALLMHFSDFVPNKLKKKNTNSTHFSNVFSFSYLRYYICILAFFYLTNSKTLEIFVFDNIISPFFFFMPFSVSVGKKLKNTENRRFWLSCFVFLYRVLSMLFSVLVPSTPINIQKALFWKSRFLSSFRIQNMY